MESKNFRSEAQQMTEDQWIKDQLGLQDKVPFEQIEALRRFSEAREQARLDAQYAFGSGE